VRTDGAIGLDEIREHGVREHRKVAKEVVEEIGFNEIVEAHRAGASTRDRKTALGQMRRRNRPRE